MKHPTPQVVFIYAITLAAVVILAIAAMAFFTDDKGGHRPASFIEQADHACVGYGGIASIDVPNHKFSCRGD